MTMPAGASDEENVGVKNVVINRDQGEVKERMFYQRTGNSKLHEGGGKVLMFRSKDGRRGLHLPTVT